MATFSSSAGTVEFTGDYNNYQENREARVAIQEIPGGDVFVADLGGRSPMKISVGMVLLNASVYGLLNASLGLLGTLAIESLDTHDAILMKVSKSQTFADGQILATADFTITDA